MQLNNKTKSYKSIVVQLNEITLQICMLCKNNIENAH